MKIKRAKVFWTGRSQAIRLPKEFRFETDVVLVHRDWQAVIVEPAHEWPEGYVESFAGIPLDLKRPRQGAIGLISPSKESKEIPTKQLTQS